MNYSLETNKSDSAQKIYIKQTMDAAPTAEIVYQGICTLFYNKDPKEKDKANKWLEEFQKSIYSWTIADELLQQKRDLHSCYFAAQTMRNKIQNSFIELPTESHISLRDSLLSHISLITENTDPIIVTQLSLAVADLALLMATWRDPVGDLLDMFSQKPQSIWPLLEILTVIPEEIDSRYLRLGANRRAEVHKQMEQSAEKVEKFLCFCSQMDPPESIWNATLRCFSSWLAVQVMPIHNLPTNAVVKQTFHFLNEPGTSPRLHETATECLCSMLSTMESPNNNNRHQADAAMFELQLFQSVCSLETAYHMSVAHEDIDKTMNYSRIFSTLCDEFLCQMLSDDEELHYSVKALDLLLICAGHFDYEVAEITFHFWYRLSEMLFNANNDSLTENFKPHIERLLGALYRHVQMDPDHDGLIDENDNFNDFRKKVSDLIKDVAFIVGSGACFKQMFLLLQSSNTTWESTEAALFIMQNVAKNVLPDEKEIVPKVIEAILNLPENAHISVRYTSILLLGELCDWIEYHPESLEAVLNFLLYGMQQKNGLANAAAVSLTSICAACRSQMTCHINGLVEIARSLESFEINNDVAIGLLKSIALILSRLPRSKSEPAMREIIAFQFQPLAHIIEQTGLQKDGNNLTRKGERADPTYWIDRACAVIRHTDPDLSGDEIHPTVNILNEAWPLISQVMNKYQSDCRIMERTCRLIRYALRMVHKQAFILVEPLVKHLVTLYAAQHHSCFLYLGSVLVDEFAKMEQCTAGLLGMLNAFIAPTFIILQQENGIQKNPDIVDDFFRLCARFMECSPLSFLRSTLVTPIFQCAILACTIDHREANSSAMKFFCLLLKCGHSSNHRYADCRPIVKEIAQNNGEVLVANLIHASVFSLSSYMLPDVAEVLTELRAIVPNTEMERYLNNAVNALPKENSGGYITATQSQLDQFSNAVLRSETTKSVTQALRVFTRLFR